MNRTPPRGWAGYDAVVSDEGSEVGSSPKLSGGGRRSSFSSAVEVAPELVKTLPDTDRFAGLGILAVLTLFGLALWLGPKATEEGSFNSSTMLILLCVGTGALIAMVIIGVLGRARSHAAELEGDESDEPKADESMPGVSASGSVRAVALSAGAALIEEQSIYTSELIEVFRAYDVTLERPVAKKVLRVPERRQDFVDGAREAIRISDLPHFTGIYAADFTAELPYILMQFIEGGTLRQYIEAQGATPIAIEVARRIVFEVGDAVFRAHQASVRIGNIKASNILLDDRDEPYISPRTSLKFVNAKQLRSAMMDHALKLEDIVYTAPELLSAERAKDARGEQCDQYALGILAYELMSSRLPPTLPTVTAQPEGARVEASCRLLLDKGIAAYEPLPPIHELRPEVPIQVSEIIAKMTALEPEQRYARLDLALAALRSVSRTILLVARDSYVRCLAAERSPTFLECFYEQFTASETISARFGNFSAEQWTRQHGKLQAAIEACFDFAQLLDPKLEIAEPNSMSKLARVHGQGGLAIQPEEYELFIDALVRTACGEAGRAPYDPKCEDPARREDIARAWRELLTPITAYFSR